MRELVRNGDLHLAPQRRGIVAEVLDERPPEERDHGRKPPDGIIAERRPVEERIGVLLAPRRTLVDLHADAREVGREPAGQRIQRVLDKFSHLIERHDLLVRHAAVDDEERLRPEILAQLHIASAICKVIFR